MCPARNGTYNTKTNLSFILLTAESWSQLKFCQPTLVWSTNYPTFSTFINIHETSAMSTDVTAPKTSRPWVLCLIGISCEHSSQENTW